MPRSLHRERPRLLTQQLSDVHELLLQLEPTVLDPLQVEEVVDQSPEPASLLLDDPEILRPLLVGERPLSHHVREPEDARERRAELVRDHAHELRLELIAAP